MSLLDVVLGKAPKIDDAEEELGKPDEPESENLPLHVSRCAKRWSLSYRLSRSNNAQLAQIRLILTFLAAYLVLTSPSFAELLKGWLH